MNLLRSTRRVALPFRLRRGAAAAAASPNPPFFSSAAPNPWLYSPGNPLLPWPPLNPPPSNPKIHRAETSPAEKSSALATDEAATDYSDAAAAIIRLLTRPFSDPSELESALDDSRIAPSSPLLEAVLRSSDLSAPAVQSLFRWSSNRCPNFRPSAPLLASTVDILAKSKFFTAAWSIILSNSPGEDSYAALIRRYVRAGMLPAAIRTFEFALASGAHHLFDVLLDSLCKEGRPRAAEDYIKKRKTADPGWSPSIRNYNILLNGWFRSRHLRQAQKLWEEIRLQEKIHPTVVTYGTMIEGLCRTRRVDQAINLLEEMKSAAIPPNEITCNPIVDALAEEGRFKEALAAVEKFPLYGISPNISTFNSLVKGFCKKGDLVGASKILKTMIARGILPTPTTYNYFFRFFARAGKIDEGMNLYEKIVQSGYSPDRLSYHLLVKMLCEGKKLTLAAQLIREMQSNGMDLDLATSSMFLHLLCRTHQFDEACEQFEMMVKKGIVPQYLSYRMLVKELNRLGRTEMAGKISSLMRSLRHSTKLPDTYKEGRSSEELLEQKKKNTILRRAQAMSDSLKRSPSAGSSSENSVAEAKSLILDIRRRVFAG